MKKVYLFLAALAIAAIGCNKAEIDSENNLPAPAEPQKENVVYIGANLPEFIDTKAAVDADGAFSWANGDAISVLCKRAEDNDFYYVDFYYDTAAGKFACDMSTACSFRTGSSGVEPITGTYTVATAAEMATVSTPFAKYPAQMVADNNLNYDKIGKVFKMEGSLETDGSIKFVHKSALLKLDYSNVPGIANYIKVINGSEAVVARLNSATGTVNTMIPVTPTGSSETIRIELCMQDGSLLVAKKKTATLVAGTLYKTPAITINPDVYLISNLTSWTYGDALKMSGTGSTRTATLVGNADKYYRYVVDFGSVQVDMGPSVDGSDAMSETFVNAANASKLTAYGVYDFTFDFVSAQNTVAASTVSPQIYLTGSFQQPDAWSLNCDTPMTMINDWEGYLVMDVAADTKLKAYTNPYWGSAFPSGDVKLELANYYLFVGDAYAGKLQGVYANATASAATSMTLKGSFDGWSTGLAMTQIGTTPFWSVDVDWANQTEFKFVKDGSTWMAYGDGSYATPGSGQDWNSGNIRIFSGKYRIIASENDGRFAILDMN